MSSSSFGERSSRKGNSEVRIAETKAMREIWESKKKELGLTQKKLSVMFQVKEPAISGYLNGSMALNKEFAAFFADVMGEPIEKFSPRCAEELALLSGKIDRQSYRYPLLKMAQIQDYREITENFKSGLAIPTQTPPQHIVTTSYASDVNAGEHGFWLRVDNDDMETYNGGIGFGKGILVLVNPSVKPRVGDYAILKIKYNPNANLNLIESNFKYLLRLIKHDGENVTAWANNPQSNPITLTELNSELIGKVVSAMYPQTVFTQESQDE